MEFIIGIGLLGVAAIIIGGIAQLGRRDGD